MMSREIRKIEMYKQPTTTNIANKRYLKSILTMAILATGILQQI